MPIRDEASSVAALIDIRPERAFVIGHVPGSVNIPLEELPSRTHELPPASDAIRVIDLDQSRAVQAAEFLRRRGHAVEIATWDASGATETGPATGRLWKPNSYLIEALDRIRSDGSKLGRALDVACGSGRNAVYLALLGYEVEAVDLLPDALERAKDLARRNDVAITTRVQDLEGDPSLSTDRYDLVCVFRYLQRSLFPVVRAAIRPGGYVVYETFHERNRDTGLKPRSPDHLMRTGELAAAFKGFDLLINRDAYEREGRFFSCLLARRPG